LQEDYAVLYERTCRRIEAIRKEKPDYKIVELWSHDWEELKKNSDVAEFIANEKIHEPLNPRDSLFGGNY